MKNDSAHVSLKLICLSRATRYSLDHATQISNCVSQPNFLPYALGVVPKSTQTNCVIASSNHRNSGRDVV